MSSVRLAVSTWTRHRPRDGSPPAPPTPPTPCGGEVEAEPPPPWAPWTQLPLAFKRAPNRVSAAASVLECCPPRRSDELEAVAEGCTVDATAVASVPVGKRTETRYPINAVATTPAMGQEGRHRGKIATHAPYTLRGAYYVKGRNSRSICRTMCTTAKAGTAAAGPTSWHVWTCTCVACMDVVPVRAWQRHNAGWERCGGERHGGGTAVAASEAEQHGCCCHDYAHPPASTSAARCRTHSTLGVCPGKCVSRQGPCVNHPRANHVSDCTQENQVYVPGCTVTGEPSITRMS